jgi:CTP:molybdopterin cytidylyltransferase MocA
MTDRSPVAGVILAAGLGRRFGGPKVAARLGDDTLLMRVSRIARDAGLNPHPNDIATTPCTSDGDDCTRPAKAPMASAALHNSTRCEERMRLSL